MLVTRVFRSEYSAFRPNYQMRVLDMMLSTILLGNNACVNWDLPTPASYRVTSLGQ